jgi:hypothetical protein
MSRDQEDLGITPQCPSTQKDPESGARMLNRFSRCKRWVDARMAALTRGTSAETPILSRSTKASFKLYKTLISRPRPTRKPSANLPTKT